MKYLIMVPSSFQTFEPTIWEFMDIYLMWKPGS